MSTTVLPEHVSIYEKLHYFCEKNEVPNILFYGPSGSGKKTIVQHFLQTIYKNNKDYLKKYVIMVNCAQGKGIKFIREELKFFAKTHIHNNGGDIFKSIVLTNGDKLTTDAQSALRRCIEMFTFNTRFFIIVEDKYRLLKPILSRFCEVYVTPPEINLYTQQISAVFPTRRLQPLEKEILQTMTKKNCSISTLVEFTEKLYEKGYAGIDIINLVEKNMLKDRIPEKKKFELLISFHKVRKEFRNEKLLILFVLNFLFLSLDTPMENISFI